MKEQLLQFLKDKKEYTDIAPFVKSTYDKEMLRHKPWVAVGESKKLKAALSELVASGDISVKDDRYLQLGKLFYAVDNTATQHHSIETLKIEAKTL